MIYYILHILHYFEIFLKQKFKVQLYYYKLFLFIIYYNVQTPQSFKIYKTNLRAELHR